MKHRALNVFAVLAVAGLLAAPMAFGDQIDRLKANIPFDFIVGDKVLPAGAYEVQCGVKNLVMLQRADHTAAAGVLTRSSYSATNPVTGKLVFTRYGNSYFLTQIWRPGVNSGNVVPPSKLEREIASKTARGASTEIAIYPPPKK